MADILEQKNLVRLSLVYRKTFFLDFKSKLFRAEDLIFFGGFQTIQFQTIEKNYKN